MRHEEVRDLVAVHALDALDGSDLAFVEAHLAGCPNCRADLKELREVAALLVAPEAPPHDSWDRLLAGLDEAARPTAAPPVLPRLSPGASPRGKRSFAVVALAGLLATGGAAWWWDHDRLADRVAASPTDDPVAAAVTTAILDGDARLVTLRNSGDTVVAAVALEADGDGFVVRSELPRLGAGRTYQLWATSGDSVVSLGVLGPAPRLAAFQFSGSLDQISITAEDAPGAAAQSLPAVAVGIISR